MIENEIDNIMDKFKNYAQMRKTPYSLWKKKKKKERRYKNTRDEMIKCVVGACV